jgi:uncharacterized membrane protein YagU involved in acid resistance
MSTAEVPETDPTAVTLDTTVTKWSSAVVASLVAGTAMGIPMQLVMEIMPTVGALYGWESLAVGWVAHLFHSAVFGVVFAGVVSLGPLKEHAPRFPESVGIGAGYGVALWVFGGVVAMPLWLNAAGLPNPGVPNLNAMSLVGHVVYGALLGGVFPAVYSFSDEVYLASEESAPTWIAAHAAGGAAGVVMGLFLQFPMDLMPAVAALYGYESVAAGWVAHLFHSLVFAVIFAGVASLPVLKKYASGFPTSVLVGVVFGVGVWVFGGVVAMPLWLASIGMDAPTVPNVVPMSLLAHTVYGGVLGVVYPLAVGVLTRKMG